MHQHHSRSFWYRRSIGIVTSARNGESSSTWALLVTRRLHIPHCLNYRIPLPFSDFPSPPTAFLASATEQPLHFLSWSTTCCCFRLGRVLVHARLILVCSTFPLLDLFLVSLVYHPVFPFGHYLPCILESTYCRIGPKMVSSAPTYLHLSKLCRFRQEAWGMIDIWSLNWWPLRHALQILFACKLGTPWLHYIGHQM